MKRFSMTLNYQFQYGFDLEAEDEEDAKIKAADMIESQELNVPYAEHNGFIHRDNFFWITNLDNAEFEVIEESVPSL